MAPSITEAIFVLNGNFCSVCEFNQIIGLLAATNLRDVSNGIIKVALEGCFDIGLRAEEGLGLVALDGGNGIL